MLVDELRRRAAAHPAPDSASVRFLEEGSVIAGMRYVWGEYHPPNVVHARFVALVAVRDSAHVVRNPGDWASAAGTRAIGSAGEAVGRCEEIIYTTSRHRVPGLRPRVYAGPVSLERLPLRVPDPQMLVDSLSLPVAQRDTADTWRVDLWAIEPRDVQRYVCRIGPRSAATTVRDSFPGFGYLIR